MQKEKQVRIRMSAEDVEQLEYCCKVFGMTRAEIIRRGIEKMYQTAKKAPRNYARNNTFARRKKEMSRDELFAEWISPIEEEYKEKEWEEWKTKADEEFQEWVDSEREKAISELDADDEWDDWHEERFMRYIEEEEEKNNEKEYENFEEWYSDHYSDWEAEMRERWDDMNPEEE